MNKIKTQFKGKDRYFLGCSRFPFCDITVSCDENGNPIGLFSDGETRRLRKFAHHIFDSIWKENKMKRNEAYSWMAKQMSIPKEQAHIGSMKKAN